MSDKQNRQESTDETVLDLISREKTEPISSFLGMKLMELTPGYARVTITLKRDYLNFNEYIFGGIIMSLVDQAFAYATNSLNFPSVASQINIHFISAPQAGDELVGECRVIRSGKRAAVSEMTVTGQDGKLIAKATGTTIPIK